jgi:DNA-binding beta-propeller fold protein YncE
MTKDVEMPVAASRREFLKMAGFGATVLVLGTQPLRPLWAATPGKYTFALRGDGKVAVIDQAAEEVVKTIETGGKGGTLGSMSADGGKLYVANNAGGQRTVGVIDARNLSFVRNVETGASPKHPVVSPDGKLVAVNHTGLDDGKTRVVFLNPADDSIVKTVEIPVANKEHKGPFTMHGSWSPDGALFAIGSYADNKVFLVRKGTFDLVEAVVPGNPHYFDWFGRQAWVTVECNEPKGAASACQVVVLDTAGTGAPKTVGTVSVERHSSETENLARIEGHHGVFTNDGARFVVCNRGDAPFEGVSVAIVDRASRKTLAHIAAPAKGVGHAYLSPDGKYALVTQYGDTKVPVIDLAKMSVVQVLDAGGGGHMGHATFSADSKKAFVSNRKSDEVVVVDMTKLAITKRIPTGSAGQAQGQLVNAFYNVFERVTNPNHG